MNRKKFIKKAALGIAGAIGATGLASSAAKTGEGKKDTAEEQVGFNHLPTSKNQISMNTILHKANTRGHANHGWLDSHHTFSFANYYDPERIHFGALRVLNDDIVAGGRGFGTHPHDNMEIISIPLEGDLAHKDNVGNTMTIKQNDVQIMSAGTGVFHSEFNANRDREVNFLQIWVFPKERNIEPNYEQLTFNPAERENNWQTVVSPEKGKDGVWINQDAWFSLGKLTAGASLPYKFHKAGQGVYAFVLSGEVEINGQALEKRDGFGIWDVENLDIKASSDAELLLMEVPMNV